MISFLFHLCRRFSDPATETASLSYLREQDFTNILFGRKTLRSSTRNQNARPYLEKLESQLKGGGFLPLWQTRRRPIPLSLQTTSTILIRWTGLLHQFYRPINPLSVTIEDPFTFSERLLEVQSFITCRNPRCMFILTTKAVSIRVYDLKHPTIFPSFRKSFFPVSVFYIH